MGSWLSSSRLGSFLNTASAGMTSLGRSLGILSFLAGGFGFTVLENLTRGILRPSMRLLVYVQF
jgi:hypothetical protein